MKRASIDMVVSMQWGETIFKGTFLSLFTFVVPNIDVLENSRGPFFPKWENSFRHFW